MSATNVGETPNETPPTTRQIRDGRKLVRECRCSGYTSDAKIANTKKMAIPIGRQPVNAESTPWFQAECPISPANADATNVNSIRGLRCNAGDTLSVNALGSYGLVDELVIDVKLIAGERL